MAVQQRIIGGGLLLAGVAVVLILIFVVWMPQTSWEDAHKQFMEDILPRYTKADDAADYLALRRISEEALELGQDTTLNSVKQEVKAEAVKGNAQAQALQKLFDSNAFEKNAKGLYALDGGWYDNESHATLRLLKDSLGASMPALLEVRRTARTVQEELERLRVGSGLPLPVPPAAAPGANPVAAADAALLAVLDIKPDDVRKALAAKGEGAKAKSARLVWNQAGSVDMRRKLADSMGKIPRLAESIERAAVALGKSEKDLKALPPRAEGADDAAKRGADYVKNAFGQLAAVLDAAARQEIEKDATIATIADALRNDAKLLKGYASNAPELGAALAGSFAP